MTPHATAGSATKTDARANQLRRAETLRVVGAIALITGVFLPWYSSDSEFASLAGQRGAELEVSGWESSPLVGVVLVIAALLPLLVAHVIARDRQVSWVPGELTALTGSLALTLLVFVGFLNRPGSPSGEIDLDWGWWVSLLGALMMIAGAILRTSVYTARRPPGL